MASPSQHSDGQSPAPAMAERVTTLISCVGVRPLSGGSGDVSPANENRWFDRIAFRKRWYANLAAGALTVFLLVAGVWIVQEFVRLQKLEACFEAGRRDCLPLDMNRRGR